MKFIYMYVCMYMLHIDTNVIFCKGPQIFQNIGATSNARRATQNKFHAGDLHFWADLKTLLLSVAFFLGECEMITHFCI